MVARSDRLRITVASGLSSKLGETQTSQNVWIDNSEVGGSAVKESILGMYLTTDNSSKR